MLANSQFYTFDNNGQMFQEQNNTKSHILIEKSTVQALYSSLSIRIINDLSFKTWKFT